MISDKIKKNIMVLNEVEPISDSEICDAETVLDTTFHRDYKWIIKNFGFLDDNDIVISGLGAGNQFENVVFLNKNILTEYKDSLPKNWIAISFENKYQKILVLDNDTGCIYAFTKNLDSKSLLFNSVSDFVEHVYGI